MGTPGTSQHIHTRCCSPTLCLKISVRLFHLIAMFHRWGLSVFVTAPKQTSPHNKTTAQEPKFMALPQTASALCPSRTGKGGTPKTSAHPCVTGKARDASLSFGTIHLERHGIQSLPELRRRVGSDCEAADHDNVKFTLSPKWQTKSGSHDAVLPYRVSYASS